MAAAIIPIIAAAEPILAPLIHRLIRAGLQLSLSRAWPLLHARELVGARDECQRLPRGR